MLIVHAVRPLRIVEMNPVHNCSFVAIDRLRPLRGIALPSSDDIQSLKAFAATFVLGFNDKSSDLFHALVPFGEIWV